MFEPGQGNILQGIRGTATVFARTLMAALLPLVLWRLVGRGKRATCPRMSGFTWSRGV